MNLRRALAVAGALVLAAVGVVGMSQPAFATLPLPLPIPSTCTIQTYNTGNFLTAVGGGGQTTDVIHSNATWPAAWETATTSAQSPVAAGSPTSFTATPLG